MSFFEFPHTRTYDTDLGWLIKEYKNLEELYKTLDRWKEETQPTIDDLALLYDQLTKGELPEPIIEGITKWLAINALDLIGERVKSVFFGLTSDGHFVAYIPESWDDISFGTSGLDDFPVGVDFGHLTLTY